MCTEKNILSLISISSYLRLSFVPQDSISGNIDQLITNVVLQNLRSYLQTFKLQMLNLKIVEKEII